VGKKVPFIYETEAKNPMKIFNKSVELKIFNFDRIGKLEKCREEFN